jgi:hypothetical protein
MQSPDRSRFIELLGQLGAEDDATVLAAARELHRTVQDAGLDWDRLLQADGAPDAELEDEPDLPRLPSRKCRRKRSPGRINPTT